MLAAAHEVGVKKPCSAPVYLSCHSVPPAWLPVVGSDTLEYKVEGNRVVIVPVRAALFL